MAMTNVQLVGRTLLGLGLTTCSASGGLEDANGGNDGTSSVTGDPITGETSSAGGNPADPTTAGSESNVGLTEGGTSGTGNEPSGGEDEGGSTGPPAVVRPFCDLQPTLRAAGACTGRLIGVALSAERLEEPNYVTAARELGYVTPENEMKWESIHPTPTEYAFEPADEIVNFAEQNGMLVKGHALVWHNQLPEWVSSLTSEPAVREAMRDHIQTVVEHFRGRVHAWDVVNEVWQNEQTWVDGQPALRDYVITQYLGSSFIDEAFELAHEIDPDAKLYYNDYRAEGLNAKSQAIYEMVAGMVERGVPIDGVGLQMHQGPPNGEIPTAEIIENMQRIADLGLEVLISEMDIHRCGGETPEDQRAEYYDIVSACAAQPACVAISFWGVTDLYSWLQDEDDLGCAPEQDPAGLLWDANFQKKPAYFGVMDALTGH